MIDFKNVSKVYADTVALKNATLHIDQGDFVFVVGPTGSGKSTFIKLIIKEIEDGFFDHIARGVIRYINKNGFGMADETDHITDIANALLSYFKNTKVNYSDREIEHIYLALLDVIEKTENSFKWLVKKKQQ